MSIPQRARKNVAVSVVPRPAPAGVLPPYPISTTHPDWPGFLQTCRNAVAGSGQTWGYSFTQVAQCWAALGRTDNSMRDWCVSKFRAALATALTKWNSNQNLTEFSGDSYLYCGDRVQQWAVILNWMSDRLTAQEIADASMILDRAVWNIWNAGQAKWNTASYPWSGWATTNPLNNYYYRTHWRSTLWWALHSLSQVWLDKLRNEIHPLVRQRYQQYLAGGGSLEGTGYGQAYVDLFNNIWLWRTTTGEDLSNDLRVPEHMEYWVRVTTPDYKAFIPFGDQSRVSYPAVYDNQRAILVWGQMLCPTAPQAALARGWLTAAGRRAGRPENWMKVIYDSSGPETLPQGTNYFASGIGQIMARDPATAMMVSLSAGLFLESHAAQDQTEFQIYINGRWRCATSNIFSHSGIQQNVANHNCLLFRDANNAMIQQARSQTRNSLSYSDDGVVLDAMVNLKAAAYAAQSNILAVQRRLVWDRGLRKVTVTDTCALQNNYRVSWRATVCDQPTINVDGSVTAGPFTFRCLTPGTTFTVADWRTLSTDFDAVNLAWLLEITGSVVGYNVEITY